MKLSVVIPAHNEEGGIEEMLTALRGTLLQEGIPFELLVINDHSSDATRPIVQGLGSRIPELILVDNEMPKGFGYAVRKGLAQFNGDCVAIMMADASDSADDLVRFYRKMEEGHDCVFGTRWSKGGRAVEYPWVKLLMNRVANTIVRGVFHLKYDDCTNAFKLYRRHVIFGLQPLISPHFNLTLEMPLKAIVRGYGYTVLGNSWKNRRTGVRKFKIKEMGSRYFFILLYCLIEKYFSMGDFRKVDKSDHIRFHQE